MYSDGVLHLCLFLLYLNNVYSFTLDPVRVPRQSGSNNSCILPPHPKIGQWSVFTSTSRLSDLTPGMSVEWGTILKLSCIKGHKLNENELVYCINGQWSSRIGQCLKTCPPLYSTDRIRVTCTHENKEIINCTDAVDGSLAKFQCEPFYESLTLQRNPIHLCIDGKWDQPQPICVPTCGQKTVDAPTESFPWHVAIYRNKKLNCGGSLISQRVILTVASCVTDEDEQILPKENYIVAAGKYYQQYNDSRDLSEAQFSKVHSIFTSSNYLVSGGFAGNIAVLVTEKTFFLSQRVQPVCVDVNHIYRSDVNSIGYVGGWSRSKETARSSGVVNEFKVTLVGLQQCEKQLPEDYDLYFIHDKFCVGYLDQAKDICRAAWGGGLVLKHDGRYYIAGIMNNSPMAPIADGVCDSNPYPLATIVSKYVDDFIIKKQTEFRI